MRAKLNTHKQSIARHRHNQGNEEVRKSTFLLRSSVFKQFCTQIVDVTFIYLFLALLAL